MRTSRVLTAVVLTLWVTAAGCTTIREIPRSAYTDLPERKGVRVVTRDGLVYDFDYAAFAADSLTGFRHRGDVEGPVDQTAMLRIALDDVAHMSARNFDWYRTGLASGTVLAGVLVSGCTGAASDATRPGDDPALAPVLAVLVPELLLVGELPLPDAPVLLASCFEAPRPPARAPPAA